MMPESKLLLSIIIPVYNVQRYLKQCLDSIIPQISDDTEIVLVDDGSIDESRVICDDYGERFPFVRTFHITNVGLSGARNFGISKARGEYIQLLDSDDLLVQNALKIIKNIILDRKPDVLRIGYKRFYVSEVPNVSGLNDKYFPQDTDDMLKMVLKRKIENYAWSFIVKRLVYSSNKIEFPVGKNYEDMSTTYKILFYSSSTVACDMPIYMYRVRSGSIANTASSKNVIDVLANIEEAETFLKTNCMDIYKSYFSNFAVSFLLFAYYEAYRAGVFRKYKEQLNKNLEKYYSINKKYGGYMGKKYKIGFFLTQLHIFNFTQLIRVKISNLL